MSSFRRIEYFLSVAKHLNFTTAARECFVAQAAISQQIKQFEEELGFKLFARGGGSRLSGGAWGGRVGCRAGRGAAGRLSGGARAAAGAAGGVDQRRPAPTRIPGGEFHVKSIFFHFTWDFFRSVKNLQETPMSNQIE